MRKSHGTRFNPLWRPLCLVCVEVERRPLTEARTMPAGRPLRSSGWRTRDSTRATGWRPRSCATTASPMMPFTTRSSWHGSAGHHFATEPDSMSGSTGSSSTSAATGFARRVAAERQTSRWQPPWARPMGRLMSNAASWSSRRSTSSRPMTSSFSHWATSWTSRSKTSASFSMFRSRRPNPGFGQLERVCVPSWSVSHDTR